MSADGSSPGSCRLSVDRSGSTSAGRGTPNPTRGAARCPTRMSEDEAWRFLRSGSMTASFASVRVDGRPHAVPTGTRSTATSSSSRPGTRRQGREPAPGSAGRGRRSGPAAAVRLRGVEGDARLIDDLAECRRSRRCSGQVHGRRSGRGVRASGTASRASSSSGSGRPGSTAPATSRADRPRIPATSRRVHGPTIAR